VVASGYLACVSSWSKKLWAISSIDNPLLSQYSTPSLSGTIKGSCIDSSYLLGSQSLGCNSQEGKQSSHSKRFDGVHVVSLGVYLSNVALELQNSVNILAKYILKNNILIFRRFGITKRLIKHSILIRYIKFLSVWQCQTYKFRNINNINI